MCNWFSAIGKIHGRYCLVSANDGTLKGGTYFPIGVQKQLHSANLADKCGVPLVILVDSGGGFLPLQVMWLSYANVYWMWVVLTIVFWWTVQMNLIMCVFSFKYYLVLCPLTINNFNDYKLLLYSSLLIYQLYNLMNYLI